MNGRFNWVPHIEKIKNRDFIDKDISYSLILKTCCISSGVEYEFN